MIGGGTRQQLTFKACLIVINILNGLDVWLTTKALRIGVEEAAPLMRLVIELTPQWGFAKVWFVAVASLFVFATGGCHGWVRLVVVVTTLYYLLVVLYSATWLACLVWFR